MNTHSEISNTQTNDLLRWSTDLVASYLANNTVSAANIPEIIKSVHDSLANLGRPQPEPVQVERIRPAVTISKSVQDDYIVCLEDGKRLKMLKRYLRSKFK